jgi:azurin/glucose/arabinose dehydrogenase
MNSLRFLPPLLVPVALCAQVATVAERFSKTADEQLTRESLGWTRTTLPVPDPIVLEVSGILALPDHDLMITTRRGELWRVKNPASTPATPTFELFASGLHEPLGIAAAPEGGYYVAQRAELTKLTDRDQDGRADLFHTVFSFPLSGSYHEFNFGPAVMPNGNLLVTLNNAYIAPTRSPAPWRGWMVEIQPNGKMIPIGAGLRSPAGVAVSSQGLRLYSDNQGEWIASGYVTEVQPGDFLGHPDSLTWSKLPGSPLDVEPDQVPDTGEPLYEVAKRVPHLKPPTVWLPYTVLGISTSDIVEDLTGGKFGPFSGQFFIGDQGQSKIMRMTLEQVKGVWQGAAYPFLSGFRSGVLRLTFGHDGSLYVGQSARGWGSVGGEIRAFERVNWTGATPFEILEIKAAPDGFVLHFTQAVDPLTAANPASYEIASFIYQYHNRYGSRPINRRTCEITKVVVAPDGLSVRLGVTGLREYYIHEIKAPGLRDAAESETLLNDFAYYTLNRRPDGDRIISLSADEAELCATTNTTAAANTNNPAAPALPKHINQRPAEWPAGESERVITLGTAPGLKFDQDLITVRAGERVQLVFTNSDDMFHNFVLCKPGAGQSVGAAALELGVDGTDLHYVPRDHADVIVHSLVLQPEETDRIYFTAPTTPGDYDYICSFPGHFSLMKGILRVIAR